METTSTLGTRDGASKPRNRIQGYFDEPEQDRRQRLKLARKREYAKRHKRTQALIASGDLDALFETCRCIPEIIASRLRIKFELDEFTTDDLIQAGYVGLWQAMENYDDSHGTAFTSHAYRCCSRKIWKEVNRQVQQTSRGFRQAADFQPASVRCEKPAVESELEDTESIAYVLHELESLHETEREALLYHLQGETFNAIGKHQGVTFSGARLRVLRAIEQLQEQVMPLMMGAWTPFPAAMGDAFEILNRLGCSFGNPLPDLTERRQRQCGHCGGFLLSRNPKAEYCSKQCKSAAEHIRRKARDVNLGCDNCSDPSEGTNINTPRG